MFFRRRKHNARQPFVRGVDRVRYQLTPRDLCDQYTNLLKLGPQFLRRRTRESI